MTDIRIEENNLDAVPEILAGIPEFSDIPSMKAIQSRISHLPHIILTAHLGDQPVGFKIGYERDQKFYSWLGAVLPAHRRQGIADALANEQEKLAGEMGYKVIWMKTRNCFPSMLLMAIRRGFRITHLDPREDILQHRIIMEKSL
jgi:ribosomal protein S18 acetylase RimI-like enzyme